MKCQRIIVGGKIATCPTWLPSTGWSIHTKGYVIYTSRKKQSLFRRGERMSRAIMRVLAGDRFDPEAHVHHQDFDKLNNCPMNLVQTPLLLNPSPTRQCPYTGRFLSPAEYQRIFS